MGTRGTLKVYLNDELKIRQYNQWDSYPTGQFNEICRFMRNEYLVERLTESLVNKRLAAAEDMKRIFKLDRTKECGEIKQMDLCAMTMRDRDFGADILYFLAGATDSFEVIPDWKYVFTDDYKDDGADIDQEEGNYVIRITAEVIKRPNYSFIKHNTPIHFTLSGEFHDVCREFDTDYVPTDDEIQNWEIEVYNEE